MKIQAILNNGQPVKAGQGKKGPWEMFEVELDSGDTATLFGPIKVGMEVETYEHEKYGLQFRTKRVSLEQIHEEIQGITKMVKVMVQRLSAAQATTTSPPATGYDRARDTVDRIRRPRPTPNPGAEPTDKYNPDEYDPSELNEIFPEG